MKLYQQVVALLCAGAGMTLAADFTYTQKSEMTGGSMKKMMEFAARFNKQAAGPQITTHRFSGRKMAVQTEKQNSIYDLDRDTITQVDLEKKEYSTITFAEMMQLMTQAAERMGRAKAEANAEINWKASVDITGKSKEVIGIPAKEAVMKVQMEATDKQSNQSAGITEMQMDMWMGTMPGYKAVKEFQKEMATKMGMASNMNPMMLAQMGSGAMKGMIEAGKKLSEVEGIPLETTVRMIGVMGMGAGMPQGGPGAEAPTREQASSAAGGAAGESVLRGKLGGLGGIGGGMLGGRLGRKKKEEAPATESAPAPSKPAAAPTPDNVAMEMLTVVTAFDSNPVDPAAFQVPAGFKQVDHPMKRMAR